MSSLSVPTGISDKAILVRLDIASIRIGDRLRKLLPDRVATLASDFRARGQLDPIDVVETDDGPRLIKGAIRIAAKLANGEATINAVLHPKGTFGSELDIREREIAETFVRFDLTALERAVYIAEWRAIHEQKFPPAKPGRKKKPEADEALDELSANFALNFTDVVQRTLGLGRRAIFLDLKVATLPVELRDQIAAHPIADKQSELLALVGEPTARWPNLVQLILAGAASVADAVATLEQRPLPSRLQPHEKLSEGFSRMKQDDQWRFFELHVEAIELWRARRVN